MEDTLNSFLKLKSYCENEKFKGWDPYDGLNSKIFQFTPFKYSKYIRAIWIQIFKLNPFNFRKLFLIPKEYNSKGIALFLSGYSNLYHLASKGVLDFGTKKEILEKINFLANLLDKLQNKNYSGSSWGYNFDWQARFLFLFPKNTPTVVATSFCVEALFKAYDITSNKKYKTLALSSAEFVINDLLRTKYKSGFIFSYSPISGNNTVFNASMLGAKILSLCYKYSNKEKYKELAQKAIKTICEFQERDGSWIYGLLKIQYRKDSFHTGYILDAMKTYEDCTNDTQFNKYLKKGFIFYINNFFDKNGRPKYYHNYTFPIDIHCPGQLIITLHKLNLYNDYKDLAERVIDFTVKEMQSSKGFFYYQLKQTISSKISYMRWSNAFMFNSFSCLFIEKNK